MDSSGRDWVLIPDMATSTGNWLGDFERPLEADNLSMLMASTYLDRERQQVVTREAIHTSRGADWRAT